MIKREETIALPNHITAVFAMLDGLELPAWLVGGCLRDLLLGRLPKDWDLTTPCPPGIVRERLQGAGVSLWETGLKHGTLTFRYQGQIYEITTFRRDGPYLDHRRPEWVEYTSSLREDLARRDFTVNAIAWRAGEGIADPFGGLEDMDSRVIRAVGLPESRLEEDALRILRGVRFAGSLDFTLDAGLASAMRDKRELLRLISPERLAAELSAILLLPSPRRALDLLAEMELWLYLAPEMTRTVDFDQNSSHHYLNVYEHMMQTVENTPPILELRLAAMLHDIAKPAVISQDEKGKSHYYHHETMGAEMASAVLDRLRFSHAVRDWVVLLIKLHMLHLKTPDDAVLRRTISKLPKPREESLERVLVLQKADLLASRYTEKSLERFDEFARRCRDILTSGCPLDIAELAVKGSELEELGVAPAKRGDAQKAMLAEVLLAPENNNRQRMLEVLEGFRSL